MPRQVVPGGFHRAADPRGDHHREQPRSEDPGEEQGGERSLQPGEDVPRSHGRRDTAFRAWGRWGVVRGGRCPRYRAAWDGLWICTAAGAEVHWTAATPATK